MEDYDRVLKRSQATYSEGKPLFTKIKNPSIEQKNEGSNYDAEHYNDEDLFMVLFKDMVSKQTDITTAE